MGELAVKRVIYLAEVALGSVVLLALLAVVLLALTGCVHRPIALAPPLPIVLTTVVRAPCPDPAERARLRAARPTPLARTPMPATSRERVDKAIAQLGRYEASGGYADQVEAVLDRCQRP